ncbi:MAG TPA: hypothetical protein VFK06_05150 [Candidatus Angelobacter sp.]|nr:hypothetical protein [Candidatus Angelobacter sp.]
MKPAVIFLLSFFVLPACFAQAGAIPPSVTSPAPNGALRGIPSSVTSPTPDGRLHGIPSTITAPGRRFPNRRVFFGDPQRRRHSVAPIPLFYSAYAYPVTDPGAYDPQQPPAEDAAAPAAADDQSLRDAYNRGAQDALSAQQQDRYGQHYLDSRTRPQPAPEAQSQTPVPQQQAAPAPVEDSAPTVFIFKDGRRIETNSYVIMGQTLFDLSSKPLKKIQMAELDLDATKKVNEDLGNPLRF